MMAYVASAIMCFIGFGLFVYGAAITITFPHPAWGGDVMSWGACLMEESGMSALFAICQDISQEVR